jgi:hypothetical protein
LSLQRREDRGIHHAVPERLWQSNANYTEQHNSVVQSPPQHSAPCSAVLAAPDNLLYQHKSRNATDVGS